MQRIDPRASQSREPHVGWRSRGYLPHLDSPETVQHVVFRLADALPGSVMDRFELAPAAERLGGVADALRRGYGKRLLADPRLASLVESALLHFDRERYRLLAWCVMPTHVHALAEQIDGHPTSAVVHSWKSYTATAANRLLGRKGPFWAPEYYDRFMRDEAHLEATQFYIEFNPVAAGLCADAADWRFSSGYGGHGRAE